MRRYEWRHALRLLIIGSDFWGGGKRTEASQPGVSPRRNFSWPGKRWGSCQRLAAGGEGGSEHLLFKGFVFHLTRELGLPFTEWAGVSLRFPSLHWEARETFKAARAWAEKHTRGKVREQRRQGSAMRADPPARAPTRRNERAPILHASNCASAKRGCIPSMPTGH